MVKVSGLWTVTTVQFAYKEPKLTGISPTSVIKSGGSRIQIHGQDLDIGNKNYDVTLSHSRESVLCTTNVKSSANGMIACEPGKFFSLGQHFVKVEFDLNTTKTLEGKFLYVLPDPSIYGTIPPLKDLRSIESGGLAFHVIGQGFVDVIQKIYTSLSETSMNGQQCSRNNSGVLKCEFPAMKDHRTSHQRSKRDISLQTIVIHLDSFKEVISREVFYVSDPVFYPLNENRSFEYEPSTEKITIKGRDMNIVTILHHYSVYVGRKKCSVLQLERDSLTFIPPSQEPTPFLHEDRAFVRVRVGNINMVVGYLQYPVSDHVTSSSSGAVVYIILASLVILSIIISLSIALIFFRRRKKNNMKKTRSNAAPLENVERLPGYDILLPKDSRNVTGVFETHVNENTLFLLQSNGLLISKQNLEKQCEIGRGTFGIVYEGTLVDPDMQSLIKVAIKTLHHKTASEVDVDNFLDEAIRMHEFNHPNVMTLLGICLSMEVCPWVVLPFMKHGDLLRYLRDDKNVLTLRKLVEYGTDIAKGMEYLSNQRIVHRDLAARNCMVDERFHIVVADFGLSRDIYEKNYYSSNNQKARLPLKWMSPESLEKGICSSQSDVWSFGVVLWELVTRGRRPYPEVDGWDMLKYLKNDRRLPQTTQCPDVLYTIMQDCWNLEPNQRPNFSDIVRSLTQILSPSDGNTDIHSDYETLQHMYINAGNDFGYDDITT